MARQPKLADLARYTQTGGRPCSVCSSPYRSFIDNAAEQYTASAISRYLIAEFKADLSVGVIQSHLRKQHGRKETKS